MKTNAKDTLLGFIYILFGGSLLLTILFIPLIYLFTIWPAIMLTAILGIMVFRRQ